MEFLKLFIRDKQEQAIETVNCYEVRWTSRHGSFSGETQQEVRVFVSQEDAEEFYDALKAAFKLIKHTSGTRVTVNRTKDE